MTPQEQARHARFLRWLRVTQPTGMSIDKIRAQADARKLRDDWMKRFPEVARVLERMGAK